jgi:hypothetical protein
MQLCAVVGGLAVINLVNLWIGKPYWGITRHIELGTDDNAAAWFSSLLLACGGLAALQCYQRAAAKKINQSWVFIAAAALMFGMSADEIAQLHETIFGDAAKLIGITNLEGAQHAGWVWIGGPVIALIFVIAAWTLRRPLLLVPESTPMLLYGLGLMFAGGVVVESSINFLNHEELQWIWDLEIIVEETMEMIGSLIVAMAFSSWRDAQQVLPDN